MTGDNHAIVFGAAGLLGWAVVEQLLSNYPTGDSFYTVTAVINRPLAEPDFYWPKVSVYKPRLHIVPGVDLLSGTAEELSGQLKRNVPRIAGVTHIFYFVFKEASGDHIVERKTNCDMMQRVVDAVTTTSPKLKSFVYAGGTRGYGIYIPGGTFKPPLKEPMADSLPEDYAETVSYPWFRKILTKASEGKSWTWSEVCPDVVVGFTPNGSGWSLALHWAQYLSLYENNHKDEKLPLEVPFPGNEGGYNSLFTPVSSRTLGRIAVHAALNPETCGGKVVNVADRERPTTFREIWPALADWFGMKGVGPSGDEDAVRPGEYVQRHKQIFEDARCPMAVDAGVGAGRSQLDNVGYWLSFDRQLSLERLRSMGFTEERDPVDGWLEAFDKFREADIII